MYSFFRVQQTRTLIKINYLQILTFTELDPVLQQPGAGRGGGGQPRGGEGWWATEAGRGSLCCPVVRHPVQDLGHPGCC